jgi:hypothetical protein
MYGKLPTPGLQLCTGKALRFYSRYMQRADSLVRQNPQIQHRYGKILQLVHINCVLYITLRLRSSSTTTATATAAAATNTTTTTTTSKTHSGVILII